MNIAISLSNIAQQNYLSHKKKDLSLSIFEKLYAQNKSIHDQSILEEKRIFLIDSIQNILQHIQQMNFDLIYSTKECEEDMLEVNSKRYQTIILAASIMFGTLSSVIVDASLPDNSDLSLVIPYALFTTLSFSFLFITIVLSIEIVLRIYTFMFFVSSHQSKQIEVALDQTTNILQSFQTMIMSTVEKENKAKNSNEGIASSEDADILKYFNEHEKAYKLLMDQRGEIIKSLNRHNNNDKVINFEVYWNNTCSLYGKCAMVSFYIGTTFLIGATSVYMYAFFYYDYNSRKSSLISISVIFVGFLSFLFIKYSNRDKIKRKKRNLNV